MAAPATPAPAPEPVPVQSSLGAERSSMVSRFGLIVRPIVYFAFRRARVEPAQIERVRRLGEGRPLIYVMRYRSVIDYLLVNAVLLREGLPLARFAPGLSTVWWRPLRSMLGWLGRRRGGVRRPAPLRCASYVAAGEPVLLFMRSRTVAGRRRRALAAARIGVRYLREVMRAQGTGPAPVLVPVAIFRGPGFRKRESRFATLVYSVQEAPGEARRLLTYLWNADQIRLTFGHPVDLAEFRGAQPGESDERRVRRLARTLQIDLFGEERVVQGPALRPRREVRAEVLRDPEIARLTWKLALERRVPRQRVVREARRYVDEMAADFNGIYFGVLEFLFHRVWRVFSGLEITGLDRVVERVKKHPVVLVPCHRSHFDYLILSYIFHSNYVSPPHIAAGINLSFWPLGPLFRGAGAFFIRRTFADNELYKLVFRKYLSFLIREGYTQEFFIEGGRTRTGKMLQPKLGMLSALVEAFVAGGRQDLYFVPISIHYGRIPEEEAYKREITGEEKQRESLLALLRARRVLSRRFGTVDVSYAEPISLRAALGDLRDRFAADPGGTEEARRHFVEEFGDALVREVNRVTVAGATSVSAAALLGAEHAAVRERYFQRATQELVDLLRARGVAFTASLARNEVTDFREGLAWLESGGLLERRRAAGASVLYVPTDKRANLDFYKNNIVHFFLVPALVARAAVLGEEVTPYVRRWLDVLAWEFTLPDDATIASEIERWQAYYVARGAITGDRVRRDHPALRATAGLLENFRESYLVAARTVAAVEEWPVARTGLLRAMRREYATGLLLGELRKPEGNSVVTFGNAIDRLIALGCLAPGVGKQARWLERGPRFDDLAGHVTELEA